MNDGATTAYLNIFGGAFGNISRILCGDFLDWYAENGLMLGCTRGIYARECAARVRIRNVRQVEEANMPNNASILGLLLCGFWFLFFYGSNLAAFGWFGLFSFDSSELPIVTIYALYIPIYLMFMKKATDLSFTRYLIPALGLIGSVFMVFAAIYAHGIQPYLAAKANGGFACPIVFYLILFAVVLVWCCVLSIRTGRQTRDSCKRARSRHRRQDKSKKKHNEIQISTRAWRSSVSAAPQGAFVVIPQISHSDSSYKIKNSRGGVLHENH